MLRESTRVALRAKTAEGRIYIYIYIYLEAKGVALEILLVTTIIFFTESRRKREKRRSRGLLSTSIDCHR